MRKLILFLLCVAVFVSCEDDPTIPTDKVISNMGITNNDIKLKKGEQFLVQINNGNGEYKVTSKDPKVATAKIGIAKNNIIITGVYKGKTEILVEDTISKENETIAVKVDYGRLSIDTKVKNYGMNYNESVSGVIDTENGGTLGAFQLRINETHEMEILESNGICKIEDTKNTNKNVAEVKLNGNKISVKALKKGCTIFRVIDQSKGKQRLDIFVFVEEVKNDYDDKIAIKGGTFTMGKDKTNVYQDSDGSTKDYYKDHTDNKSYWNVFPTRQVNVKNFTMGKYPVTNAQFVKFLNDKGNKEITGVDDNENSYKVQYYKIDGSGGNLIIEEKAKFKVIEGFENYPVDRVSYFGAKAYADWVGGRLPTEAEYEYASYGGQLSGDFIYPGANDIKEISYELNNSVLYNSIFPIGQQKPNELGLYDMIESAICADDYHETYEGAPTDGSAWDVPKYYCVLRGGKNFERRDMWLKDAYGGIRVVWDN